ncbi:MAG: L-aspartate oxidase [Verrucomicrobia bacterium]|nr:L-aspartate oxidase [Verrucomicrobiota bacterium]
MNPCDVLIIGAGIAGATAAIELAKKGWHVVLLAAGTNVWQSNSSWAQGGIVFSGEGDTPEKLISDIEEAGAGLCSRAAVEQLARLGPNLVEKFLVEEIAVPFDRTAEGELSLTEEGAHSMPRILHHKDRTGLAIMQSLFERIQKMPNIELRTGMTAIDLITLSHHSKKITDIYHPSTCVGAYVFCQKNKQVEKIFARETILATGGLGEVFLHTTNPKEARGDGIAMAYRAGARIMNLEYVQFHPTTLYVPGEGRFLLSEALRGEGGRLLDARFQPFMHTYHDKGDLAPRDVVSRAIFSEMLKSSADHMWLDITMHSKEWLKERFPAIYGHCLQKGFDLASEPVPIVPAAHYSCGGISVDLNGCTSIRRLRAIGEVSCTGLHGANRLASTSLLEGLVWGWTAAQDLGIVLPNRSDYFPPVEEWVMSHEKVDAALIQQDWMTIKQTMWNYVGLSRDQDRLRRALKMLGQLQWEIDSFYERAELVPDLIGLRNGVLTSTLIAQGAWRNKRSRGCHFRSS